MKISTVILLSIATLFAGASVFQEKKAQSYTIPEQTLDLFGLLGDTAKKHAYTLKTFELGALITLKEYKEYLTAVRKDSSATFYYTQLPDSTIGTAEVWNEYSTNPKYEAYPALGISWDNAMLFCRWKTLKENPGKIKFFYRLPHCSEWLAAWHYLENNSQENDLNKLYSEWLYGMKDESILDLQTGKSDEFLLDFAYHHAKDDPRALKRKLVIGNSFLYAQAIPLTHNISFYADQGYKQIAFRWVKQAVEDQPEFTSKFFKEWNIGN